MLCVDASIVGDLKEVLKLLNEQIPQQGHEEWLQTIRELKEKYPMQYDESGLSGPLYHGGTVPDHRRESHHHHRGGTAPDVGGAVL